MSPKLVRPGKPREFTPKFAKPLGSHCDGCYLEYSGAGYVPAFHPQDAKILLVGEGPWFDEVALGEPFVGAAGSMLSRILGLIGRHREQYAIDNVLRCAIPGGQIDKFYPVSAAISAIDKCQYLDGTLAAPGIEVVVPMGAVPLRRILGLFGAKDVRVQDFHGTVQRDPSNRFWVVPSYHPSHLQRGATNLIGTAAFDHHRAVELATGQYHDDDEVLILDPPVDYFDAWADQYIAAVLQDPFAYPLGVDIETPEKGADEGALVGTEKDATFTITRVNFSCHPLEGLTVPYEGPYIAIIDRILAAGGVMYFWFKGYDMPRLVKAGHAIRRDRAWDLMWAWKALQSDAPMGLGFAAPFYCRGPAWKHLAKVEPVKYAATDGARTRRTGDGIVHDLITEGRWNVFLRHQHEFHYKVLQPATDVGVAIDREKLTEFKAKLDGLAKDLLDRIQDAVPDELLPRTPPQGLTRPPLATDVHTKARAETKKGEPKKDPPDPLKMALFARAVVEEKLVLREVYVCGTCGEKQVVAKHRCKDKALQPQVTKDVVSVPRWFWKEPFNPDSPDQMMAFVEHHGYTPGTSKQTGEASVDRETLVKLWKESKDPFFKYNIDYRAVGKVRGTYAVGTEKRLDTEDRVHPETTFKPSTMRMSQVNPNWENVVADKGGKESLAAGFRNCVVARGRMVDEGSEYADDGA